MIARETADEYCTIAEAAALLRVSKPTVARWIASGRLAAERLGPRTLRIRRTDLRSLRHPVAARRTLARHELERYIIPHPSRTRTEEESMAIIEEIAARVRAQNGGKPLGSSLPLIHEQRR